MKRYLLFGGADYYPGGGMNDFMGDYDTIEEAQAAVGPYEKTVDGTELHYQVSYDWADIWEMPELVNVASYRKPQENETRGWQRNEPA